MSNFQQKLTLSLSRKLSRAGRNGFTLVELIVVVAIIGILAAIAVPSFQNAGNKAKQKEASMMLSSYIKAAQAYYTDLSQMPVNAAGLVSSLQFLIRTNGISTIAQTSLLKIYRRLLTLVGHLHPVCWIDWPSRSRNGRMVLRAVANFTGGATFRPASILQLE